MKLWNIDFQSVGPAELHSADNERRRQNVCRAHRPQAYVPAQ
jgi:hypothetical protein